MCPLSSQQLRGLDSRSRCAAVLRRGQSPRTGPSRALPRM